MCADAAQTTFDTFLFSFFAREGVCLAVADTLEAGGSRLFTAFPAATDLFAGDAFTFFSTFGAAFGAAFEAAFGAAFCVAFGAAADAV